MKSFAKASLWLLLTALMLAVVGCDTNPTPPQPFSVERQTCILKHINFYDMDEFDASITIDVPVNAPKALTDSITVFINKNLYAYFEYGDEIHIPYQNVYSIDLSLIAEHYWDAYRSFYEERELATHWLDLNLVAQTDTYVTYEEVWAFRGEGIHEGYHWTTFAKEDGHRLKEVISNENMTRFFEDNPDLTSSDILSEMQRSLSEGYNNFAAGLLSDSLTFVYVWGGGHDEIETFDLNIVKPYLSKEAQKLVSGK